MFDYRDTRREAYADEELIPISKMAELHGISRQTLILYDKKDIFKPEYVSESGYRYYSVYQIPYLREICLMKRMGVSLEQIHKYMGAHSTNGARELLMQVGKEVDEQIEELTKRKAYIQQRLKLFEGMNAKRKNVYQPYVEWCEEQKIIFAPFEKESVEKHELHLTLMKAWNMLMEHGMIPSKGFGALVRYDPDKEKCLTSMGSIIQIPFPEKIREEELYTIPAGEYVTMYKYGMPYELEPTMWLVDWIHEHGYEVNGVILDMCLLDTTFYDEERSTDFCQLKIPIREV